MLIRRTLVSIVVLIGVMAVSSVAISQDRDGDRRDNDGERRDGDSERRRDGERDRERGRDVDPRDIIRMADDNNDGVIDPSEVGSRSGYYIRRAAERAGLDATKPIPVDKLVPALEAMRAERSGGSSASSSSASSSSPAGTPTVAGFGAPDTTPKAVGFNVPLTVNSAAPIAQRFDPRVIDYVNEMLKERDVNKNGILEKNEWTGRWSTPAADSDTNKDGVLDMQELCVRISNRFNVGRPGSTPATTTATPASSATPSTSTSTATSSSSGGDSDRYRRYAEGFIRQYDTNKDGKLDKEESARMRPEHQSADVNKDGIITQEEMQAKLQSYASNSAGGSSSSGGGRDGDKDGGRDGGRRGYGSRGQSEGDKAAAGPRKSFRITTNSDRLPKGLPDWFLRSDGNGDGQVSMAEYTTSWTEQLAAEFAKNDLNGDGIITPAECAVPEKSR